MAFLLIKHKTPKIPHIKLDCLGLCGLGGVGSLIDPHRIPDPKKKVTLLDKLAFHALRRCVVNYYLSTVWTSRYTLKQRCADPSGTRHEICSPYNKS
jgi:hypothetical protein